MKWKWRKNQMTKKMNKLKNWKEQKLKKIKWKNKKMLFEVIDQKLAMKDENKWFLYFMLNCWHEYVYLIQEIGTWNTDKSWNEKDKKIK